MDKYQVTLNWKRTTTDFIYETYNRTHTIVFSGGEKITVSASPTYFGKAEFANPEEFLLAAVSSCYMLTFLAIAAKQNLVVESYEDHPEATLGKNDKGRMYVSQVILKPKIIFASPKQPDPAALEKLHEKSHANCFITNSLLGEVKVESSS